MHDLPVEIECKYLVSLTDPACLRTQPGLHVKEIEQTYLVSPEGVSERVRSVTENGLVTYTHTIKSGITPLKRSENEEVIDRATYQALLARRDPNTAAVYKVRYAFPYAGRICEVDVYRDFDFVTLEVEVEREEELKDIRIPPFVTLLRDVSTDKRYTNHALAKALAKR